MTTALRAGRRLVMMVVLLTAAVGCTGASSSSSCSGLVRYEDRGYLPIDRTDFTVGERLGTATVPACDDTPNDGGGSPEEKISAYAVEGVAPSEAIAVGDTPAEARLMEIHH